MAAIPLKAARNLRMRTSFWCTACAGICGIQGRAVGGGAERAGADQVDAADAAGAAAHGRTLQHTAGLHGHLRLCRPLHLEGLQGADRQVGAAARNNADRLPPSLALRSLRACAHAFVTDALKLLGLGCFMSDRLRPDTCVASIFVAC